MVLSSLERKIRAVVRDYLRDDVEVATKFDVADLKTTMEWKIFRLTRYFEEKVRMTAAAAESALYERLATRIGVLLAETASLRDSLAKKDEALNAAVEALANADAETQRKIAEALELDAQLDAARIEELLRQAGEDVPAEVPAVEVPPAGEPATPPADAPAEVPAVDEGSLPSTDVTTPTVDPVPSDPAESSEDVASPGDTIDPGAAGDAEPVTEAPAEAPAGDAPVETTPAETPAEDTTGGEGTQNA